MYNARKLSRVNYAIRVQHNKQGTLTSRSNANVSKLAPYSHSCFMTLTIGIIRTETSSVFSGDLMFAFITVSNQKCFHNFFKKTVQKLNGDDHYCKTSSKLALEIQGSFRQAFLVMSIQSQLCPNSMLWALKVVLHDVFKKKFVSEIFLEKRDELCFEQAKYKERCG